MSSCSSKGDDLYSPDNAHKDVVKEYKANFVKYYGEVNPKETWDFSMRGSTLAGVATTRGGNSSNVQDMKDNRSYGYNWNHSNDHSDDINKIDKNYWETIIAPAIDNAPESDWNPSSTSEDYTPNRNTKIVFDVLITTKAEGSSAGWFTWGIKGTDQGDLFMRQVSPANGRNWKNGNSGQQHTSSLDFSMIPSNATWFTSHTAQNSKKYKIDDSNTSEITKFKNVTVTIAGKDYTFWCFKCDDSAYADYKDLVLWVSEAEPIITPVESKRYMVEDLGGADDFDFNDVVFDVVKYDNGTEKCYVRALGGTLDITIKIGSKSWAKSEDYNVKEMLNTNPIDANKCLKEFDVTGQWNGDNNKVSVIVKAKDGNSDDESSYYNYTEEFPNAGDIPLMVATMISKTWQKERARVTELSWFTTSDIDLSE